MKRSRAVHAFLIVSAAGTLNNCGQRHEAVRRCVDENGNYSEDLNCSSPGLRSGGHHYAWVYTPAGSAAAAEGNGQSATGKGAAGEGTAHGVIGGEGAAHASSGAHGGGGGE